MQKKLTSDLLCKSTPSRFTPAAASSEKQKYMPHLVANMAAVLPSYTHTRTQTHAVSERERGRWGEKRERKKEEKE